MPQRPIRLADRRADRVRDLRLGFERARLEAGVPGPHSPAAVAEAERVEGAPRLPGTDATDIPFLTIDPPGSQDLDQALHIERRPGGFRVRYAIADVAAFVAPDGPLSDDAWERGVTYYSPDGKAPLHPRVLSEGAASLLPAQERPALVWTLDLDADGTLETASLARALVQSVSQLTYGEAQRNIDLGQGAETLGLLRTVGELRRRQEIDRGGVHLPLPEQLVVADPEDGWRPAYRAPLPVEDWNAQISLLTGIAAAELMLEAKVGLVRTVPEPDESGLARLRRAAAALQAPWPETMSYPEWIRTLEPAEPAHAPLLHEATSVMRGAAYLAFDGERPADARHGALATEYAHVTAPLRRLADRYTNEVCLAICAGETPPQWAREALPRLPEVMRAAERRANALERAVVDFVEAVFLSGRVGERFRAVVVDDDRVQLCDGLAVRAAVEGEGLPLGEIVEVELVEADPGTRKVRFRF